MNLPNLSPPERREGSFATGAESKDPVSFTIGVPRQFHGILRLRYAHLSAAAPLRMTAISEVRLAPKITLACCVPQNDWQRRFANTLFTAATEYVAGLILILIVILLLIPVRS